jgi:hypothetical protein
MVQRPSEERNHQEAELRRSEMGPIEEEIT